MDARAFDLREVAVAPGAERDYDAAEWADALVVVARGEIELEGRCGVRRRFARGDVIFLVGLNLRVLRNDGDEPAVLLAVSRRRRDTIGS
jgi:quercetin dioxygenase-like cupin family protein